MWAATAKGGACGYTRLAHRRSRIASLHNERTNGYEADFSGGSGMGAMSPKTYR